MMATEQPISTQESGKDVLYQPGISFKNPKYTRPATRVRGNPWFYEQQVPGPLSASSKLKRWEKSPELHRYKAVWNRQAKQRVAANLGAYFQDMPTAQELGLGQAPPATSPTATTSRSPLGFLENLVSSGLKVATGVTDILANREAQKQEMAVAQIQAAQRPYYQLSSDNTMLWVAGAGVLGLGLILYMRRK
jgi:hypothetical protein